MRRRLSEFYPILDDYSTAVMELSAPWHAFRTAAAWPRWRGLALIKYTVAG
jgi:hypothetical protein